MRCRHQTPSRYRSPTVLGPGRVGPSRATAAQHALRQDRPRVHAEAAAAAVGDLGRALEMVALPPGMVLGG